MFFFSHLGDKSVLPRVRNIAFVLVLEAECPKLTYLYLIVNLFACNFKNDSNSGYSIYLTLQKILSVMLEE